MRPYQVISVEDMKFFMEIMEVEVSKRGPTVESRGLTKKAAYFMSCFGGFLRGGEVFIMDEP